MRAGKNPSTRCRKWTRRIRRGLGELEAALRYPLVKRPPKRTLAPVVPSASRSCFHPRILEFTLPDPYRESGLFRAGRPLRATQHEEGHSGCLLQNPRVVVRSERFRQLSRNRYRGLLSLSPRDQIRAGIEHDIAAPC